MGAYECISAVVVVVPIVPKQTRAYTLTLVQRTHSTLLVQYVSPVSSQQAIGLCDLIL